MLHNAPTLRIPSAGLFGLVHSGAFCMNGAHAKPGPAGCIVEDSGANEMELTAADNIQQLDSRWI